MPYEVRLPRRRGFAQAGLTVSPAPSWAGGLSEGYFASAAARGMSCHVAAQNKESIPLTRAG